jgi:DNA-binding NtrC family response regulator
MQARILIVDDEKEFADSLAERLVMRDYEVSTASDGKEAVEKIAGHNFDVVILDVAMPGMGGIETLREIKRLKPLTEVIMLTGHGTVETAVEGMQLGALDYLMKPCETDALIAKINRGYGRKTEHEARILEARVKEIISSPRSVFKK